MRRHQVSQIFTAFGLATIFLAYSNCSPGFRSESAEPTSNLMASGDSSSRQTGSTTTTTTMVKTPSPNVNGASPQDWPEAPSYTKRRYQRYVNPSAQRDGDGLKPETAWQTLQKHVSEVPSDCEIIFAVGTFTMNGSVYSSYWEDPKYKLPELPPGITIRGEGFRTTILKGSSAAGNAFTIHNALFTNSESDLEIYGLSFRNWADGSGNGVITLAGNVNRIRIIGNHFKDNGSPGTDWDHTLYFAGGAGDNAATAPRTLVIEHNWVESMISSGASLIHSWNNEPESAPHDVLVRYNRVQTGGAWGIILTPYWATGGKANWQIYENDIQGNFRDGVIYFGSYAGTSFVNGADSTFSIHHNTLINTGNKQYINIPNPNLNQPTVFNNLTGSTPAPFFGKN